MKTSEWLKKYDITLKKKFGQNFLNSNNIPLKIAEKSGLTKNDYVIEIGPGAGTLTEELLKLAESVHSFEIDYTLIPLLKDRFKDYNNFILYNIDFLEYNLSEFNEKHPVYIANIPYNISSPILEKIFTETPDFKYAVLMVQKEFGERVAAISGKDYSPLSIFVQTYCNVKKLIDVPSSNFIPQPKIDSIVIKLEPHNLYGKTDKKFFDFVHRCFSQRRKTIKNNLKNFCGNSDEILDKLEISPMTRPENISVDTYIKMFDLYKKMNP